MPAPDETSERHAVPLYVVLGVA